MKRPWRKWIASKYLPPTLPVRDSFIIYFLVHYYQPSEAAKAAAWICIGVMWTITILDLALGQSVDINLDALPVNRDE